MTLVLFDLDDTLLDNRIGSFLPAYVKALAMSLCGYAEPEKLAKSLMKATSFMISAAHPDRTLMQNFDSAFYPALGRQRAELQPAIDDFYKVEFQKLRPLTHQRPEAIRVVNSLIAQGDRVAIATNPLFPPTAILQRLAWAGLPADKVPFELVPSYETFHFAKPNPAFFAEFLAQLGWPEGGLVMVGDDFENDIQSARQAGLKAFWVTDGKQASPDSIPQGSLEDFLVWLRATPPAGLNPDFHTPEAIKATLNSTPAALGTILSSHSTPELVRKPAENEWSASEVICHLRDVEAEVALPRIQLVLKGDNPFLPGQDTDRWAEERKYSQQDGRKALRDFTALRMEALALLEKLSPEEWHLPARHAIFGPSELHELVNITTGHDRLHVRQILKVFDSQSG